MYLPIPLQEKEAKTTIHAFAVTVFLLAVCSACGGTFYVALSTTCGQDGDVDDKAGHSRVEPSLISQGGCVFLGSAHSLITNM